MGVGPLEGLQRAGRQRPLQDLPPVLLRETFEITALGVGQNPRAAVAAAVLLLLGLLLFGPLAEKLKNDSIRNFNNPSRLDAKLP